MSIISPARNRKRQVLTWQQATWEEYTRLRDDYETSDASRVKLFFYDGALLVDDMGWEGINHAMVRGLFDYILLFWFAQHSKQKAISLGGALFEKDGVGAG
ncbi:MAG: hypothetical protein WBD47_20655, partial [Phormidesmis sp.]